MCRRDQQDSDTLCDESGEYAEDADTERRSNLTAERAVASHEVHADRDADAFSDQSTENCAAEATKLSRMMAAVFRGDAERATREEPDGAERRSREHHGRDRGTGLARLASNIVSESARCDSPGSIGVRERDTLVVRGDARRSDALGA